MAGRRDVKIAILGDARDFGRAAASAERDAKKLNDSFAGVRSGAARMAKAVAIGAGAVVVGGVALAKGFVDAAIESQKVTKQTEAVLKSMGDQAGVSAGQVAKLSTKLSMQSGIDDELIQSGQNLLLTFANVRNGAKKTEKNFDRATAAALDMSVALGTDMRSASMLVGKALNDPIKGLTALRRSGIQFTEQQQKQIKAMVAVGDVAGAQRIMLKELERQFGGSAAAQATATDKLKVAWGNIQEQLGARLLPVLNKVADWLSKNLPGAIDAAAPYLSAFAAWFGDTGEKIGRFVSEKVDQLRSWWDTNGPTITKALEGFGSDVNTYIIEPFTAVVKYMADHFLPKLGEFTTWIASNKTALEGFAVVVGVVVVAAYAAWAAAAAKAAYTSAVAWFVALGPVLLILAALVLVGAALYVAYQLLKDKWGYVTGLMDSLANATMTLSNWMQSAYEWAKKLADIIPDIKIPGGRNNGLNPINLVPGLAHGGPVAAGSPYIVGERGPELFMPGRSGTIIPNNQLSASGGGGFGGPQTIVVQIGDEVVARVVANALARGSRRGVA